MEFEENIPEPLATKLLLLAAKSGKLEIKEEDENHIRVRGTLFLSGPLVYEDKNLIQGVAVEDVKKGQLVKFTI